MDEDLRSENRTGPNWQATWTQSRQLLRDEAGEIVGEGSYKREVEGEFIVAGPQVQHIVGHEIDVGTYAPELSGRVVVTDSDRLPPRATEEDQERWCYRFLSQHNVLLNGHNPLDD